MNIRCAHCKGRHASIQAVRACASALSTPPPGRYAVWVPNEEPDEERLSLHFFVVTEKRFLEQAGPNFHPIPKTGPYRNRVIREIMKNPRAAMALYGQKLRLCAAPRGKGTCGLPLTDPLSRMRGIGPNCWERLYGCG